MSIFGETFKNKREELGLSVSEVSQKLDIQERYIQAIEEGNLQSIPGEYYTKNFVSQYAKLLNLDGDKLLAQYTADKAAAATNAADQATKPLKNIASGVSATVTEGGKTVQAGLATAGAGVAGLANAGSKVAQSVVEKKSKKGLIGLLLALLFLALGGIYLATRYSFGGNGNNTSGTPVTTSQETTTQESTTTETTTVSESTTESTETTAATTETTIADNNANGNVTTNQTASQANATASTPVQSQPAGNGIGAGNGVAGAVADVFAQNSAVGHVTYGLGQSYAGYTGDYRFNLAVTEPTWVRATVHGTTVYEGLVHPGSPLNFWAVNNATSAQVLLGISNGATLTMNGQVVPVPTTSRVQTVQVNFTK